MLGVPRTGFSFKPETVDCEKVPEQVRGFCLYYKNSQVGLRSSFLHDADPPKERVERPDTPRCFEAAPGMSMCAA